MQALPVRDKGVVWTVFDEIVKVNRKIEMKVLVRELMRRMDFWNRQMKHHFKFTHISDNSAFNQYRNVGGSYDYLEVERHSKQICQSFDGLEPVRMRAAPKFNGSVEARVRLMMALLQEERFIVSFACLKHKSMLLNIASEKAKAGTYDPGAGFKPKRSVHIHPFDSMTYPMLEADVGSLQVSPLRHGKAELIDIGVGNT